jgi:hypothetical protein
MSDTNTDRSVKLVIVKTKDETKSTTDVYNQFSGRISHIIRGS